MTLQTSQAINLIGKSYRGRIIVKIISSIGGRFAVVFDDGSQLAVRDLDWFILKLTDPLLFPDSTNSMNSTRLAEGSPRRTDSMNSTTQPQQQELPL